MVLDWGALEAASWEVEAEIAAPREGQAMTTGGDVSPNTFGRGISSHRTSKMQHQTSLSTPHFSNWGGEGGGGKRELALLLFVIPLMIPGKGWQKALQCMESQAAF